MNKKLQVFVSSTYTDLIEERQAAVQAILDAGHIPAGMELFKAGKSQMKTIRKWIDESDVYMLILGGRYGSIEEKSGLSYTELEYKYALSKNMPVFAIVLDDNFLFTKAAIKGKNVIFEKDNLSKYETFKALVMSKVIKKVNNISSIESVVHSTLYNIINDTEYNLIGWIKGNTINNDPIITHRINFLEKENKILKSQITSPQNKLIGKYTTTELISNLSSIDICNKLIAHFGANEIFIHNLKKYKLYQANALEFFYAFFSFLSLGIPNDFFCMEEIDEEVMELILYCSSILISFDLITITQEKEIILTDIAKNFYIQLLSINYTPSTNLLSSLIEMAYL